MTFITFIYKIDNDPQTYYGKYCFDNLILDRNGEHEGLDKEVKGPLMVGIKKQKNLPELKESHVRVGVLSYSFNECIYVYSSYDEIKCFDFYCANYDVDEECIIYMNGELVDSTPWSTA